MTNLQPFWIYSAKLGLECWKAEIHNENNEGFETTNK